MIFCSLDIRILEYYFPENRNKLAVFPENNGARVGIISSGSVKNSGQRCLMFHFWQKALGERVNRSLSMV